ncbi:MAG: WD40 repeat domain-containing protein [bacterium]
MARITFCALVLLALSACSSDDRPSGSWELAAQGFYTGAISANGQLAVVGSLNHGASMWRTSDKERLFNWAHASGEFAQLVAAGFSPDGTKAVTTDPRTLVLWDTSSGKALNYWATPGAVMDVAVLNDNRHVLLGLKDHSALLFDATSGAYESTLLHQGVVGSVDVTAAGDMALTGSDDYTAVLWHLNSGAARHTFQHDNPVRTVALSEQGNYSFTAAQGDLVAIWDNSSGALMHTLHSGINHGAVSARFSSDESLLAVGYANRRIILYRVSDGRTLQTWDPGTRHAMRPTGASILEIAFHENSATLLALSGDGRLLQLQRS